MRGHNRFFDDRFTLKTGALGAIGATGRTQGTHGVTKFLAVVFVLRFQAPHFCHNPRKGDHFEYLRPTFKRNPTALEDHDRRHVMERRDDRDGNGATRAHQAAD